MKRSSGNKISFIAFKDKPSLCFDIRKKGDPVLIDLKKLSPLIQIKINTLSKEFSQQQPTANNVPVMPPRGDNVSPIPNNIECQGLQYPLVHDTRHSQHQGRQYPLMPNFCPSPPSNQNEELTQTNDFDDLHVSLDPYNQFGLFDDSNNDYFNVDDDDILDLDFFNDDDDPNL